MLGLKGKDRFLTNKNLSDIFESEYNWICTIWLQRTKEYKLEVATQQILTQNKKQMSHFCFHLYVNLLNVRNLGMIKMSILSKLNIFYTINL